MGRITPALYVPLGLLPLVVTITASGCGGDGKGAGTNADGGGKDAATDGAAIPDPALFANPMCRTPYPAHECNGDPHGRWTLAGLCVKRYENCAGAVVSPTGTGTATNRLRGWVARSIFQLPVRLRHRDPTVGAQVLPGWCQL
jgi:hypothetical protein